MQVAFKFNVAILIIRVTTNLLCINTKKQTRIIGNILKCIDECYMNTCYTEI